MKPDDAATALKPPHEGGFVVLPRLTPVERGIVLHYGDHGVLFGEGRDRDIIEAFGFRHFERALNPLPILVSVAIFDRPGSINYTSSAQVALDGNRGWMFGINGRGFYDVMSHDLAGVMNRSGADSLEGYVVASHTRLMIRQLRAVGNVKITDRGEMNGHAMDWVVVTRK